MRALKPHRAAQREAWEEAGVVGHTGKRALGRYPHAKRLDGGEAVPCEVMVFPKAVDKLKDRRPERRARRRRWVSPEKAAAMVDEEDLAALLRGFGARRDGGTQPHSP